MSSKKSAVETAAAPPPLCLICKRVTGSWTEMEAHLATAHVLYRPHQCSQCEFNSPDVIAMAEHANETRHRGRLYERDYDLYKQRYVERLMGDHRKHAATPAAGAIRISAAAVEVGEAPKKRPLVGVKIEECDEVGESPRAEGTGVGTAKRIKGGDGKVAKPARKTGTCRYKECGAEVGDKPQRHIEGAHLKSGELLCPVQQCPSRAARFSLLDILRRHIKKAHGGMDALGAEEKSRLDAMTKSVKGKVEGLWPQCYPDRVQRRKRGGGKTGGVAKKRTGD